MARSSGSSSTMIKCRVSTKAPPARGALIARKTRPVDDVPATFSAKRRAPAGSGSRGGHRWTQQAQRHERASDAGTGQQQRRQRSVAIQHQPEQQRRGALEDRAGAARMPVRNP